METEHLIWLGVKTPRKVGFEPKARQFWLWQSTLDLRFFHAGSDTARVTAPYGTVVAAFTLELSISTAAFATHRAEPDCRIRRERTIRLLPDKGEGPLSRSSALPLNPPLTLPVTSLRDATCMHMQC